MQQNLQHCLQLVLESEGGFVDNAKDPGGATNFGITQATLTAWRKTPVTVQDVRDLAQTEAELIMRAQYATPIRFDALPDGLDYAVLDCAVNSGPAKAARLLQGVLGVDADGVIGLHTLAALPGRVPADLIHAYSQARLAFLRSLPTWSTFGRGWAPRVARVERDAAEMATGIPHAAAPPVPALAGAKAPPAPQKSSFWSRVGEAIGRTAIPA